jgi:two-component system NarL family response regulator
MKKRRKQSTCSRGKAMVNHKRNAANLAFRFLSPRYPAIAPQLAMSDTNIRVLLADDHPVVRSGLAMIIQHSESIETVAEASTGAEAVELYRQHQPDVVLMDLKMPQMGGVEAIATIRQEFPAARIIVLTTYDGDEDIYRGLSAGARGYLLKNVTRQV